MRVGRWRIIVGVKLEWRDAWVGVYWDRTVLWREPTTVEYDIYVCVVPFVPIIVRLRPVPSMAPRQARCGVCGSPAMPGSTVCRVHGNYPTVTGCLTFIGGRQCPDQPLTGRNKCRRHAVVGAGLE